MIVEEPVIAVVTWSFCAVGGRSLQKIFQLDQYYVHISNTFSLFKVGIPKSNKIFGQSIEITIDKMETGLNESISKIFSEFTHHSKICT